MHRVKPFAGLLAGVVIAESAGLVHREVIVGDIALPNEHVPHEDSAPAPMVSRRNIEINSTSGNVATHFAGEGGRSFIVTTSDGRTIRFSA